jgi:imidazolonepropionase
VLIEVGPTRRVENLALARGAIEVAADGRVVMPGFVDSHTHLLFPVPGAPADGFEGAVRTLHATTASQLKVRATTSLQAMVRHGTTTVEIKTGSGADDSAELKMLRVLGELKEGPPDIVATLLFRPPRGLCPKEMEESLRQTCREFLPRIGRRRLVQFADLVWDDFDVPLGEADYTAWFEGYFQAARSLGLGCKLHADAQGLAAAAHTAVAHHAVSIDHLEHATAADLVILSQSDTVATLLPCASFYGDGRYAPARALIDLGVPVAIATNFNGHQTPLFSMQAAVALACQRMGLTPAEAVCAATINGAHAAGRAGRVGSLECGKLADLLFLNVPDYRDLADSLGANLVHMVMKSGEIVYEEGAVQRRPVEDLRPVW